MTMQTPGRTLADPLRIRQPMPDPEARDQAGALCRNAEGAVLLVTSLTTGRWVLPKGWPMPGLTLAQAALQEAWEEAGVQGSVTPQPLGSYLYGKDLKTGAVVTCRVWVFGVRVRALAPAWPEAARRQRLWLAQRDAAQMVAEPGLRTLLGTT